MKLPKLTKQQYIVIGSVAGISVIAAMVVAIVFVVRKQLNSKQTMGNKTTGSAGVALIKQFEGCRLTAYKPVPTEQYYTIGYGHYGADVQAGQTITQTEAETLLRNDLQRFEACINAEGLTISQNQFDALVSLCYNIGEGNLRASTLLRKVKANPNDASIADEFLRWNKSGGSTVGLEQIELAGLYTQAGRIVCEGEFRIYDLLGRDVTRLNGSLCGVYVVKTANAAQKVIVK